MEDGPDAAADTLLQDSFALESQQIRVNPIFDPLSYPSLKQELKAEWDKSLTCSNIKISSTTEEWFERLWKLHTDQGRHYHSAVHLQEMLSYVRILEKLDQIPQIDSHAATGTLRWAVFFHDAIYDVKSGQNEKDSERLFVQFWDQVSLETTEHYRGMQSAVSTLILATEKHQVIKEATSGNLTSIDLQELFLDVDMAVLGKSQEAYFAYARLIRKEYQHVPQETYCQKRAAILESFEANRCVFLTRLFRQVLEDSAKSNLRAEVKELRAGRIPGMTV